MNRVTNYHKKDPTNLLLIYLCVFYIILTLYASLYTNHTWQVNSLNPFEFWQDKGERYISRTDIWLNVLAYIPLGFMLVWLQYGKRHYLPALFFAVLFCSALSFGIECLQTYIPKRAPTKLDWYTNTLGGLMGGIAGVILPAYLFKQLALVKAYIRHFNSGHSFALLIYLLWLIGLLAPQAYWLGLGYLDIQLIDYQWQDLNASNYDSIGQLFNQNNLKQAYQWLLIETQAWIVPEFLLKRYQQLTPWVSSLGVIGMTLVITLAIKPINKPATFVKYLQRSAWFVAIALSVIFFKALNLVWQYGLNLEIPIRLVKALGFSVCLLIFLAYLPMWFRASLACLCLLASILLGNALPPNEYFAYTMQLWQYNRYIHMLGLSHWLNIVLPWLAMVWALYMLFKYAKLSRLFRFFTK